MDGPFSAKRKVSTEPGQLQYPFILLEALPNGQTILDVVVQIMAGVFTLLLAYRLKLGLFVASLAAILFEANGTFAWLNAGWCYPLPFLPLLLYGIELTVGPVLRERVLGTILIAVAVAVSISAAMIEVAYLDGILCVIWALLRIAQTRNARCVLRLIVGALLGIMIATPILIRGRPYGLRQLPGKLRLRNHRAFPGRAAVRLGPDLLP
jgi:hypothetical protein